MIIRSRSILRIVFLLFILLNLQYETCGRTITADSSTYLSLLPTLKPADTLILLQGFYREGFNVHGLNGTGDHPILITGPESGSPAVIEGRSCCNTISIKQSSYVHLKNLKIDGLDIPGIDGIKAEGSSGNWAHHITLENLVIVRHGQDQQQVGISTKCPAWDWRIHRCIIERTGTGMYLGNSDGTAPFVNGIIEYNLVGNTIGYNIQVKHQNEGLRILPGMTQDGKTIIRYNVLTKEENASTGGNARPNLLVGNFPASGPGSADVYEIYGNFIYQNPVEALFQGTGNIALYDNLFVNHHDGWGVAIMQHNGFKPREVTIFHNTVLVRNGRGVNFYNPDPAYTQIAAGNLLFAPTPLRNAPLERDNITGSYSEASGYLKSPSTEISILDCYPLPGVCSGAGITHDSFKVFTDWEYDFNGARRTFHFRGAYSGEGVNPGWKPAIERRPEVTKEVVGIEFTPRPARAVPSIDCFPNPFSDRISIRVKMAAGKSIVRIMDVWGRTVSTVFDGNAAEGKTHFFRTASLRLRPGVYFVIVRGTSGQAVSRVIHVE